MANIIDNVMKFGAYADLTGDVMKSGVEYVPNGAEHLYWPRVLDNPPIAELPIPTIMERAQGSIAESFGAFKSVVQIAWHAGYKTISVVPLKVFNIAKNNSQMSI